MRQHVVVLVDVERHQSADGRYAVERVEVQPSCLHRHSVLSRASSRLLVPRARSKPTAFQAVVVQDGSVGFYCISELNDSQARHASEVASIDRQYGKAKRERSRTN